MIASIALAVSLVLCGVGIPGAYYVIRTVAGNGQPTPVEAVDGFLTAVFREGDVSKANKYVCPEARDDTKLAKKIDELNEQRRRYRNPQFTWAAPTEEKRTKATATVNAVVKLTTSDDRVSEQKLRFLTVKEAGWWVCEVRDG